MNDAFTFERFQGGDTGELEKFYGQAFGDRARYKFPERWEWISSASEAVAPGLGFPFYIAYSGKKIVGHNGAIRVRCKLFDEVVLLSWSVDSYVASDYRGKGIGKKLQTMNQRDHDIFASIAMTPKNQHLKKSLGAIEGPTAYLFCKFFSMKGQLKTLNGTFGKLAPIMWCPAFLSYIIWRLCYCAVNHFKISSGSLSEIDIKDPVPADFGPCDDELWKDIRGRYDFAVERDSVYLNWRYRDQPWASHSVIRAYNREGGLEGLAVFRVADESFEKGGIVLEAYHREDDHRILELLISACENSIRNMGGKQVQYATASNLVAKNMLRLGYLPIEKRPLIMNGSALGLKDLNPGSTGMISKGDQDWDQYSRYRYFDIPTLIYRALKVTVGELRSRKHRID